MPVLTLIAMAILPGQVAAVELFTDERTTLNLDLGAGAGVFHSEESYAQALLGPGDATWQEGFGSIGLSGSLATGSAGEVYGNLSMLTSGTWGDGDAAGYTTGDERTTDVENAFLGWRSGKLFPALGKNGLDVSFGRQTYKIGDGFLIDGDPLNFGDGLDPLVGVGGLPGDVDRGGAYYMAPRTAFDETAVLRLGPDALRGEFFWLQSDNKAQSDTELVGTNLTAVHDRLGTFGLTWLHGLSVDDGYAEFFGQTRRDGQDTFGLRYDGSAGVSDLAVAGEYVWQDNGSDGAEQAWYLGAGWSFRDTRWTPGAGARFSTFSSGFDPLFYGFSTNYGTWFQGEVAGNYAGPFNTNTSVWHAYASAQPTPKMLLGLLYFHFDPRRDSQGEFGGDEVDLYVEWTLNDHVMLTPLFGIYRPDQEAADGGAQLGGTDTNVYLQATVTITF